MTNLKGGYIIVNKNDANIYASLENALTSGKPVLYYEDANICYFIDSISKSGDDIVLTKGGKTITITDANVVTENGEIQNHLYILSVNSGDYVISFITTKSVGDYSIESMTTLTDNDKSYIKSLKDVLINFVGSLYGCLSTATAFANNMTGIYGDVLYLNIDSYEYEIDLNNPTDQSDGDNLTFKFTQIF